MLPVEADGGAALGVLHLQAAFEGEAGQLGDGRAGGDVRRTQDLGVTKTATANVKITNVAAPTLKLASASCRALTAKPDSTQRSLLA